MKNLRLLNALRDLQAMNSYPKTENTMKTYDVTLEEFIPGFRNILCPICGHNNVHHNSTTFQLAGNDDYKGNPKVRGDVIVIPGWCEAGCKFNIFLGEHKGSLLIWGEERQLNPANDPKEIL